MYVYKHGQLALALHIFSLHFTYQENIHRAIFVNRPVISCSKRGTVASNSFYYSHGNILHVRYLMFEISYQH